MYTCMYICIYIYILLNIIAIRIYGNNNKYYYLIQRTANITYDV